jgi:hypothetical protein
MTIERPMFPPADPTRRHFLTVAAGGAVAAAIPTAAVAGIPTSAPADPAFALIAAKQAADIAHGEAIEAQDRADVEFGYDSVAASEADESCSAACWAVHEIDWHLARTSPTTLAGVAAVLRFANQIEDGGMEWPSTDTVGAEGWHYQLRATMAAAIEVLIKAQAGKAVQS